MNKVNDRMNEKKRVLCFNLCWKRWTWFGCVHAQPFFFHYKEIREPLRIVSWIKVFVSICDCCKYTLVYFVFFLLSSSLWCCVLFYYSYVLLLFKIEYRHRRMNARNNFDVYAKLIFWNGNNQRTYLNVEFAGLYCGSEFIFITLLGVLFCFQTRLFGLLKICEMFIYIFFLNMPDVTCF